MNKYSLISRYRLYFKVPKLMVGIISKALLTGFSIFILCNNVIAEEKEEASETKVIKLDKVVITTTKYEKSVFETSMPVTVIGKQEIAEKSPMNVGDLLKEVAGVEIHHDGTPGISKARIRGLSANRVLVLIDGKRWNSHVSSLTGGVYINTVDVNQVEKIEVLHGPASVLYGSGAIGGVINIITQKAKKSREPYLDVKLNTVYASVNDNKTGRIEVELGDKGLNLVVGATKQKACDVDTPDGILDHSSFENSNIDVHARYIISDKQCIGLSLNCFKGNMKTPISTIKDVEQEMFGVMLNSDTDCIFDIPRVDRSMVCFSYEVRKPFPGLTSFNLSAHAQKEAMEYINSTTVKPDLMPGEICILLHGFLNIDTYSAQARGVSSYDLIFSQVLTFGMEYYRDEVKTPSTMNVNVSVMEFSIPTPLLDYMMVIPDLMGIDLPPQFSDLSTADTMVDGNFDNVSFYAQHEIEIFKNCWLNFGGRYDWYKSYNNQCKEDGEDKGEIEDSAFTGGGGLLLSLTDHLNIVASVSKAFRAPSLEERFYMGAVPGGVLQRGNPEVKAEKSINYEAGFKIRHPKFSGAITGFLNKIDNYILMTPSDDPTVFTFGNLGKVEIQGIEGSMDFQMSSCWSTFSTVGYTRGLDKIGDDPLEGIPPLKVIIGLRYSKEEILVFNGTLWAEISARLYDKQDRIPDEWTEKQMTPRFGVCDFRVGGELRSLRSFKDITVTLEVENIANQKYKSFPMICMFGWDDSLIQPGRNIVLSLGCKI